MKQFRIQETRIFKTVRSVVGSIESIDTNLTMTA